MRYTLAVANPFVQSMASNFKEALGLMEAALTDCPTICGRRTYGLMRHPRVRRRTGDYTVQPPGSWLTTRCLTLDYDLTAEFDPWEPPQPFDENTYASPNRTFTKAELLGYIVYCRGRVRATLDALTEDVATRPLPAAHRYHGMLYGVIVGRTPLHVLEHASQIRQFLTAAGVKVLPMPGDRGYVG